MAKTQVDVDTRKADVVDETSEASGLGWQFWVFVPLAVLAVAGTAYLVARRFFGGSDTSV